MLFLNHSQITSEENLIHKVKNPIQNDIIILQLVIAPVSETFECVFLLLVLNVILLLLLSLMLSLVTATIYVLHTFVD